MCTSISGALSSAHASRNATEVWVRPPALRITGWFASAAPWIQSSSSASLSLCRTMAFSPSAAASASISAASWSCVVSPYTSGSRRPSRPRFGPLITCTIMRRPRRPGRHTPPPAATGPGRQPARLGQSVQHHEPQHPGAGLLVPGHVFQQLRQRVGVVADRQAERGQDGAVPPRGGVVEPPGQPGQLGGEDQAHRHCRAVPPPVALAALDRMPQRVPVVEDFAQLRLLLVGGDDVGLDRDGALDQLGQHLAGRVHRGPRIGLDEVEDRRIGDEAGLDDFGHAGHQLVGRQRV